MTVHYRQQGVAIIVFGNTYPIRDQIKALGGRFNGADKNWRLPFSDGNLTLIADLCRGFGGGPIGEQMSEPLPPLDLPVIAMPSFGATRVDTPLPGITVRQLMDKLHVAVTSAFPEALWVTGEIQNLSVKASGVFFDLAEGRAQGHASGTLTVRSILWGGTRAALEAKHGKERLEEVLQDGMQIRCLCQVQLYKDRGSVSLVVEDLDPAFTKGALALAREQLLKELRAKGLDQAQRRLRLSPFPFRVGLISAAGSRAESDFMDQLLSLGFPGEVLFAPAPMQGEKVPVEVVRALAKLVAQDVDLVVITRGGGSAADLRWFDARELAFAVATCPVPVVAAIGHHDDVSVTEEICHLRQKTPTAAADFVASRFVETRQRIDLLAGGLAKLLARRVDEFSLLTATLSERLAAGGARALEARGAQLSSHAHGLQRQSDGRLATLKGRLGQFASAMALNAERGIGARAAALAEFEKKLTGRDPKPWLKDGWTQLSGRRGAIRRLVDATVGDFVTVRLLDGKLKLQIAGKEEPAP